MTNSRQSTRARSALAGLVLAAGPILLGGPLFLTGVSAPASAQVFFRPFFHGGYYEGPIHAPVPRRAVGIGALGVLDELRDRGYRGLTIVNRREDVFIVDAIDPRRQRVRLIVDAYDGEILERFARERDNAPREAAPLSPEPRRREQARPPKAESGENRVAEIPVPPRRPGSAGPAAGAPVPAGSRPAPVAPARDPSTWAPINAVPVAPLE